MSCILTSLSLTFIHTSLYIFYILTPGSNKKRLFLSPDSFRDRDADDDSDGVDQSQPMCEDVLVVSLGIANECPGMLAEGKVS